MRAQGRVNGSSWHKGCTGVLLASAVLIGSRAATAQEQTAQPQGQIEIQKLLPEHATITQQMSVDFGNGVEPGAIAVVYMLPPVYAETYNVGLRLLRHKDASEWSVGYEERNEIDPGGDNWTLQKVKAATGQEGLVVVYYHSGAGTTTDWKLIAAVRGKFVAFDPKPMRDKVLKERHAEFMGYNVVKADGDIVTETIPGYSPGRARCCPDKPRMAMRVRFMGTAIKLDGVSELPEPNAK